ncbi:MAG: hypothetical protein IPM03_22220 [Sulfuritalea sp.]|nr:hypothetical protein [Sulfuritalea sp.]
MGKKNFQAGQLIPTSSTPPGNAGFYRIDKNTIGVVGNLVQKNANTNVESNVSTGANLAAELAAISAPVPLWVCGMPFVLFAGDGGSNGMLFTGTAGGFTLSAAVLTGLVIPVGYCYLPANAGGLGNAAGWFYFEMSSSTAGTVYNNGFTPTPGELPVVPAAKTAFANPAGGRITQTTADITMLSCSLAAGAMGKNGLLKAGIKYLAQATASLKRARIYVDTTLMHTSFGTSSCSDYEVIIQNTGALNAQMATRSHWALAGISNGINGDLTSIDFAANRVVSAVITIAANTESVLIIPRYLNLQAKA